MTPKFKLICDVVFRAQGNTNHENSTIASVSDQRVTPQTQKTVNCALQVPRDLGLSIQNCDLISVEYRLKVRDDVIVSIFSGEMTSCCITSKLICGYCFFPPSGVLGYQLRF